MTTTVDGRITLAQGRSSEEEAWQSLIGPSATTLNHIIREFAQPQAILEGSGSFLAAEKEPPVPLSHFEGDPAMLYEDFLPSEVVEQPGHRGWFTVVDSRGLIR